MRKDSTKSVVGASRDVSRRLPAADVETKRDGCVGYADVISSM